MCPTELGEKARLRVFIEFLAKKVYDGNVLENFALDNFAGVRLVICAADRKVDFGARIQQGIEYCAMDKHRRKETATRTRRPVDLSHAPEEAYLKIDSAGAFSEFVDGYLGRNSTGPVRKTKATNGPIRTSRTTTPKYSQMRSAGPRWPALGCASNNWTQRLDISSTRIAR